MIRLHNPHWVLLLTVATLLFVRDTEACADERPNIFLAIADDWGYPFAGAYGAPVVQTPTFDHIAREGVLFQNAFVSSPSCTPSRGALMTGQYHWRLEENANLWSTFPSKFRTYPELLRDQGYFIGHMRKAWGPGRLEPGGRKEDPSGPNFRDFQTFLAARPAGKPFCFWFGSSDPHRPYDPRSGVQSGMKLDQIDVPKALPDHDIVRSDIADYFFEVQRFDREVGAALELLKKAGELDNTIIVITGDHGLPFPRGKSNLYDLGTRVPLAIRWGNRVHGGRKIEDLVSLTDLAPTFLEAAGQEKLPEMTGRSLFGTLISDEQGRVDLQRDHVLIGKERHVPSQEIGNTSGYPSRTLRTDKFLYIRNLRPELWPNGIPDASQAHIGNSFADCDNGPSKTLLMDKREDPIIASYFDLAFAKRPPEELYDLKRDPDQLENVALNAAYARILKDFRNRLTDELMKTQDPRIIGGGEKFDAYPYYGPAKMEQ